MNRLPFLATLADAIGFVWQNRKDFLAFAYLPIIANSLIDTALSMSLPRPLPADPREMMATLSPFVYVLWAAALVAALGFYIVFAVAWHRRCLLPGETTTVGAALLWRRRHWRFLRTAVLLAIGMFGAILVGEIVVSNVVRALAAGINVNNAAFVASIVTVLIVLTIFSRFLTVFPAIAVDDSHVVLREAWRMTRGSGIVLFTLLFTISLSLAMVTLAVQTLWLSVLGPHAAGGSVLAIFVLELLDQFLTFTGVALTTTVASIAYRYLSAQPGGSGGGTV